MEELIYGERKRDLLPGLLAVCKGMKQGPDEKWKLSVRLEPDMGYPLLRAVTRAEAELLIEDTDAVGTPDQRHRTPDQRRADALVRVVERLPGRDVMIAPRSPVTKKRS
jgi:hypothetical protein